MDRLKRRQKIEALLAGWFEAEGYDVYEGVATITVGNEPYFGGGHYVSIDLFQLAENLESQLERALA